MGDEGDEVAMTEAQKAIWAKKKEFGEKDEEELREYMEQRAEEMRQLEEELEELKTRQAERRLERQEEMERMQEMQRTQEEQRKADEEERKAKQNAEKRRKEAERKRKLELMAGGGIAGLAGGATGGKPSFMLPQKEGGEPAGPKIDPTQTKEEAEASKLAYLAKFADAPDFASMDATELRMRIKGIHEQISRNEAAKYDMEERLKTQDYDLKELRERAKQQARQKAIKKGLDPETYANAKHPPKKSVASKFDRQTDRRGYGDRRDMYEKSLRMDGKPVDPPPKAIFHGSAKPPENFGRSALKNEELESLRKILEPPKYQEVAPLEGAKPPVPHVASGPVPEDDDIGTDVPPPPKAAPAPEPEPEPEGGEPAAEPEPEPEAAEGAAEDEEEEE